MGWWIAGLLLLNIMLTFLLMAELAGSTRTAMKLEHHLAVLLERERREGRR